VQLVRQLDEAGLADAAARWRRRMTDQLNVPAEPFAPPPASPAR
jgi:hypothetical protein